VLDFLCREFVRTFARFLGPDGDLVVH
jgi:hypothetical protein